MQGKKILIHVNSEFDNKKKKKKEVFVANLTDGHYNKCNKLTLNCFKLTNKI